MLGLAKGPATSTPATSLQTAAGRHPTDAPSTMKSWSAATRGVLPNSEAWGTVGGKVGTATGEQAAGAIGAAAGELIGALNGATNGKDIPLTRWGWGAKG